MLSNSVTIKTNPLLQYLNNHVNNKYDIYAVSDNFVLEQVPTPPTKYFTVASTISALTIIYGELTDSTYSTIQYPVLPKQFGTNHPEIINMWFQLFKLRLQHKLELGIPLSPTTTFTAIGKEKVTTTEKSMNKNNFIDNIELSGNTTSSGDNMTESVQEIQGDGIMTQLTCKIQGKCAGRPKKN